MSEMAILYDSSRCTACRGCQVACKQWNDLPPERTRNTGSYENPLDLTPSTRTRIKFIEVDTPETPGLLYVNLGCMHCTDAPCVKVCSTGALQHQPSGAVTLDSEKCNGCGYCAQFCPFNVPRLTGRGLATTRHCSPQHRAGAVQASKCTMCQDRITSGEVPACVKTCPANALSYGPRSEMVARGRERVERRKSKGDIRANLYGETILGGLHRLFVLTEPPELYGLPTTLRSPATAGVWRELAQSLTAGPFALGMLAAGIALAVARRNSNMQDPE